MVRQGVPKPRTGNLGKGLKSNRSKECMFPIARRHINQRQLSLGSQPLRKPLIPCSAVGSGGRPWSFDFTDRPRWGRTASATSRMCVSAPPSRRCRPVRTFDLARSNDARHQPLQPGSTRRRRSCVGSPAWVGDLLDHIQQHGPITCVRLARPMPAHSRPMTRTGQRGEG
jgi:hypothetical protein